MSNNKKFYLLIVGVTSRFVTCRAFTLVSFAVLFVLALAACSRQPAGHHTVLCVPVYGQSLALGEEAERQTDFDMLADYADGRIVTEHMDHQFGYFDNDNTKQWVKQMVGYQKRAYELSVYKMAQVLADQTGSDTLICIFPGGQGATALAQLGKGTAPYHKFISDIEKACHAARENGWDFTVPAVCWMQGESDIADYPDSDYRELLTRIRQDMDNDIRHITHQQDTVRFVVYQPNALSRAPQYQSDRFDCRETRVPQTFVDLLCDDTHFWASGPTYPYPCVGEKIHIDATGQQAIGQLAAHSVMGIVKGRERFRGLIPLQAAVQGHDIVVSLNTPCPPLHLDTVLVAKADHYGFSVISPEGRNIVRAVTIGQQHVTISCSQSPAGCRVRYAVNGDYMKSGNQHGPRGNVRDSDGHWCYQFDISIPSTTTQQ